MEAEAQQVALLDDLHTMFGAPDRMPPAERRGLKVRLVSSTQCATGYRARRLETGCVAARRGQRHTTRPCPYRRRRRPCPAPPATDHRALTGEICILKPVDPGDRDREVGRPRKALVRLHDTVLGTHTIDDRIGKNRPAQPHEYGAVSVLWMNRGIRSVCCRAAARGVLGRQR
jgi:hypothetical protein